MGIISIMNKDTVTWMDAFCPVAFLMNTVQEAKKSENRKAYRTFSFTKPISKQLAFEFTIVWKYLRDFLRMKNNIVVAMHTDRTDVKLWVELDGFTKEFLDSAHEANKINGPIFDG